MAPERGQLIGTIDFELLDGHRSSREIHEHDYLIFGRLPTSNIVLPSLHASSTHFSIYVIIPDWEKIEEIPPLVYCQDCSSVGTYANRLLMRQHKAVLLQDGWSIIARQAFQGNFTSRYIPVDMPKTELMRREMKCFEDKYQILPQMLGLGGWGRVQLAHAQLPTDQLACKIVKANDNLKLLIQKNTKPVQQSSGDRPRRSIGNDLDIRHDRKYSQSYMKEAKLLASLDHPNIVRMVEAFHGPENLYMMLELYPGGDLFSYLYRVGRLPRLEMMNVMYQIMSGVEYLHALNVVHRDLKLENILLSRLGLKCRFVIADFGNARDHLTGTPKRMNSWVGTQGYQAPELSEDLARSSGLAYGEAIDIWACGIMASMLVSGQQLKGLSTELSGCDSLYPRDLDRLAGWNELDSPMRKLIRRMLAFRPDLRVTASEAKDRLTWAWPGVLQAYESAVKEWTPRKKSRSGFIHDLRKKVDAPKQKQVVNLDSSSRVEMEKSKLFGTQAMASPVGPEEVQLPINGQNVSSFSQIDFNEIDDSSFLEALEAGERQRTRVGHHG